MGLNMLSNRTTLLSKSRPVTSQVDLQDTENIPQVTTKGHWKCCRIDSIRLESNYSSQLKSTCHTTGSRFARQLENIPQVTTKGRWKCCRIERLVTADVDPSYRRWVCTWNRVDSSTLNQLPVRRIDFTDDESCQPVRIASIRQHLMPLFNALRRKKV